MRWWLRQGTHNRHGTERPTERRPAARPSRCNVLSQPQSRRRQPQVWLWLTGATRWRGLMVAIGLPSLVAWRTMLRPACRTSWTHTHLKVPAYNVLTVATEFERCKSWCVPAHGCSYHNQPCEQRFELATGSGVFDGQRADVGGRCRYAVPYAALHYDVVPMQRVS
jgi:hypothetical protein